MSATSPSPSDSLYFDAPIAIFHTMNSSEPLTHMPQPTQHKDYTGIGLNHEHHQHADNGPTYTNRHLASPNHPYSPPQQQPQSFNVSSPHPAAESAGWLPAVDEPLVTANQHAQANTEGYRQGSTYGGSSTLNRSNTHNSAYYSGAESFKRGTSVRSRKSLFTDPDGEPVEGSMFIGGAATTGPKSLAERDPELLARSQSADEKLTPKQRAKAAKSEAKESKRLSKVIKQEGKIEKQAFTTAIRELANLQKIQAEAVKNEAKANATHTKILAAFQKEEAVFLAARTRFEAAQARLHTHTENVSIVRNNAREATEKMQEKSREVDGLRHMMLLDEKERAVRLNELKAKDAVKPAKPAKAPRGAAQSQ